MRAEGLEPPESNVTPVLQTGAFAAQPRPRGFVGQKKREGDRRPSKATHTAALSSRSQGNSVVKQQKERDSWLPREAVPLRSILEVVLWGLESGRPALPQTRSDSGCRADPRSAG